ncbi:MAG: hypothetical protein AAF560_33915, partial [Acidobacteriota bacterium]
QSQLQDREVGAVGLATATIINVPGVKMVVDVGLQLMTLLDPAVNSVPVDVPGKPLHMTDAEHVRCGSVAWFVHMTAPRTHCASMAGG